MTTANDAFDDVSLFDLPFVDPPVPHILDELFAADRRRPAFGTEQGVLLATRELARRRAVAAADVRLPQGAGVVLALRERGRRVVETLNGDQFFAQLCRRAAMRELSVYFLGGVPGAAATNAHHAERVAPGLVVVGVHDGCFAVEESEDVIDEVNISGADIVVVGFAQPRREAWLHRPDLAGEPALPAAAAGDHDADADRRAAPAELPACAAGGGAKRPAAPVVSLDGHRRDRRDRGLRNRMNRALRDAADSIGRRAAA